MPIKTIRPRPPKYPTRVRYYSVGGGRASGIPTSGLEMWLKADAITGLVDNDPISTWADSSVNGRNATQSGTARPTYKVNIINGLPVARFDGADDFFTLPNFLTAFSAGEIFLVIKLDNDPPSVGSGGLWD